MHFVWDFVDLGPSIFLFDLNNGAFRGYGCLLSAGSYFYSCDGTKSSLLDALSTPSLAIVSEGTSEKLEDHGPWEVGQLHKVHAQDGKVVHLGGAKPFQEASYVNGSLEASLPDKPVGNQCFWRMDSCIQMSTKSSAQMVPFKGYRGIVKNDQFYIHVPNSVSRICKIFFCVHTTYTLVK